MAISTYDLGANDHHRNVGAFFSMPPFLSRCGIAFGIELPRPIPNVGVCGTCKGNRRCYTLNVSFSDRSVPVDRGAMLADRTPRAPAQTVYPDDQ